MFCHWFFSIQFGSWHACMCASKFDGFSSFFDVKYCGNHQICAAMISILWRHSDSKWKDISRICARGKHHSAVSKKGHHKLFRTRVNEDTILSDTETDFLFAKFTCNRINNFILFFTHHRHHPCTLCRFVWCSVLCESHFRVDFSLQWDHIFTLAIISMWNANDTRKKPRRRNDKIRRNSLDGEKVVSFDVNGGRRDDDDDDDHCTYTSFKISFCGRTKDEVFFRFIFFYTFHCMQTHEQKNENIKKASKNGETMWDGSSKNETKKEWKKSEYYFLPKCVVFTIQWMYAFSVLLVILDAFVR